MIIDYHKFNEQILMTNAMLPHGIFKEYYISHIYCQKFNLIHLFFNVFDS